MAHLFRARARRFVILLYLLTRAKNTVLYCLKFMLNLLSRLALRLRLFGLESMVKRILSLLPLLLLLLIPFQTILAAETGGFPDSLSQVPVKSVYCTAWQVLQDPLSGAFTVPSAPGNKLKGGLLLDAPLALQGGHEYLFVCVLRTTSTYPADSLPSSVLIRSQSTDQPQVVADQSSFHSAQYTSAGWKSYYFSARFSPEFDIAFPVPVYDMSGHVVDLGTPSSTSYVQLYAVDVTASGGQIDLTPIVEAIQAASDLNHDDLTAQLAVLQSLADFWSAQCNVTVSVSAAQSKWTLFDWLAGIYKRLTDDDDAAGTAVSSAADSLSDAASSQSAAESALTDSLSGALDSAGASSALSAAENSIDSIPVSDIHAFYLSEDAATFNSFISFWIGIPLSIFVASLAVGLLR